MRDIIYLHLHSPSVKAETPISDHSAREIERLQMCQMIPDMQWAFERYLVTGAT